MFWKTNKSFSFTIPGSRSVITGYIARELIGEFPISPQWGKPWILEAFLSFVALGKVVHEGNLKQTLICGIFMQGKFELSESM